MLPDHDCFSLHLQEVKELKLTTKESQSFESDADGGGRCSHGKKRGEFEEKSVRREFF